jgi:aminoglycoside phosphotransferase (APT) family kinase protein
VDAQRIARAFAGEDVVELDRYETGLCHWVYRCEAASGRVFVLRVARPDNRGYIDGGIANGVMLAEQGVPVARVLGGDAEAKLPWMVVEHLDGRDLGEVYADLSRPQKTALAREVVQIQQKVASLGEGEGFGYTHVAGEPAPFDRWDEVVDTIVQRSLGWLAETGLDVDEEVELVRRRLDELRPALREVRPVPFLDDLTTKNVLVHQGRLSGIVDVDEVCYGDRMMWVGLTRMALLNAGHDVNYVEDLLDELGADDEDRARCDFYTGLYAFVFLSEQGVAFNGEAGEVDEEQVGFLRGTVDVWLR